MKFTHRVIVSAVACVVAVASSAHAIDFQSLLDSYDVLQTVAGTGQFRSGGFNGWMPEFEGRPATQVELSRPHMTMADAAGNLYIADKDAHGIRIIYPDGTLHTIAGTNVAGYNGDGPGTQTQLSAPNGLYTLPDGTTYILDLGNGMIRKLDLDLNVTTIVDDSIIASGTGRGLWVDRDESVMYYSAGTSVRKWTAEEGITTYADGFAGLGNFDVDPSDGNLVVTDRVGHSVYKIYPDGTKVRIAGNGTTSGGGAGQPAVSTGLNQVRGVYFHPEGGYFLATHRAGQLWFVDDNEIIHLLIDGDDDHTHAGDGLPLSTPGKKISEPRAVTLALDGDLIVTENDFGFVRYVESLNQPDLPGDVDYDADLDGDDIELLSAGVRRERHPPNFDFNDDTLVDDEDRSIWIEEYACTFVGDANLDGEFNSGDFVDILQVARFETGEPATWSEGDFNGDGFFNTSDLVQAFVLSGYEQGPRTTCSRVHAVPEPSGAVLLMVGVCVLRNRRRDL